MCIAGTVLAVAIALTYVAPSDWHFFVDGSNALLSGRGLHLYTDLPRTQIGPLALLVAAPLSLTAAHVLIGLLIGPTLWFTSKATGTALWSGLLLVPAWTYMAVYGHLDDALAVCLLAAVAGDRARPRRAGLWFGLAVACKPVAVFAVLLLPGWPAAAVALAVAGALAAPFVIADPSALGAAQPTTFIYHNTLAHVFGATSAPGWLRAAQLGLAVSLGVAGRSWWRVPFLAAAARIAIDSQLVPYYPVWLIVGALLVDGMERRRVPWVTLLSVTVFGFSLHPQAGVWWLLPLVLAVGGTLYPAVGLRRLRAVVLSPLHP